MFCKLFKYDLKELFSKVWLMYVFLILTALLCRSANILQETVGIFEYLYEGGIFLLIIGAVVILIATFLSGIRHFYKKMLTDEGYLTNTLPAGKASILTSKTLSMMLIMVLTVAIIVFSIFIALYEKEAWQTIWNMAEQGFAESGISLSYFLTFILTIGTLNIFTIQLVIQCALAIGHSFSQNKMGYSIGFGFAFYVAYQILNVIGLGVAILTNPQFLELANTDIPPSEIITPFFAIVTATLSILSITSIFLMHHFMKNKLNLE